MKRYDSGATIAELWPRWSELTGMSRHTLSMVVRGVYDTRIARALHVVLNRPLPGLPPKIPAPGPARIPRLTPERLLKIRVAARAGTPLSAIAHEFQAHPDIVRLIVRGTYRTRSMKKALAMEADAEAG
ncbi:hypothetical protein [Variovorax sp. W2I14]|uniref:hypothetical protein n=1 Tax=Variovorax sp. W2I14 TaxID=3042290 RepID=UPI003D2132C4